MKNTTFLSIALIILGFVFEYFYYTIDSTYWNTKLFLLGTICIVVGFLSLWVSTILPYLNKRIGDGENK